MWGSFKLRKLQKVHVQNRPIQPKNEKQPINQIVSSDPPTHTFFRDPSDGMRLPTEPELSLSPVDLRKEKLPNPFHEILVD